MTVTLSFHGTAVSQALGRFRLSVTDDGEPLRVVSIRAKTRAALERAESERTEDQKKALTTAYRAQAPGLAPLRERSEVLKDAIKELNIVSAQVLQERASHERPSTYLRERGSFLSKGEKLYAGTPRVLPPMPDDQMPNRLGLARWLVSPANPLTARVVANRAWEGVLRARARRNKRGLRHAGLGAVPPRAARLAGNRADGPQVEPQVASPAHRHFGNLPPIGGCQRWAARARSLEPAARPRPALPHGGRDAARRRAERGRAAQREGRRPERLSAATRGHMGQPVQRREVGVERRRGSISPQPLHVHPPHLALPEPGCLRRDQPRALHGAPRADEHAAAGLDDAER